MKSSTRPLRLVVAGGGTAGWMAAAAFGKLLGDAVAVCIIESEAIGRVGVGEATIPPLRNFHHLLGIDEAEMMRATQATVKLGIEFRNWGSLDDSYIHSFGTNGRDCWACDFTHFWLGGHKKGLHDDPIGLYCRELLAAQQGRAMAGPDTDLNYAYHFDAVMYADYLKGLAIKRGARFVEGVIEDVRLDERGHIAALGVRGGELVEGDLFIDCTGFRGLLIRETLGAQYQSWQQFLPCDSAVAVQTEKAGPPLPYTRSTAHGAGWQWRIPLQHRVGNGLVYCSDHLSDDEAVATIMASLDADPITEPRVLKFQTGRCTEPWRKNCIAMGLSSGFLEPLESTSIHLIMSAILRLIRLMPQGGTQATGSQVAEYNRQTNEEMERVRNFLVLHYNATLRDDSAFWRQCRDMSIPPELAHRMELFRDTCSIPLHEKELFRVDSWIQVMLGQHLRPQRYHPIVDAMEVAELRRFLEHLKAEAKQSVARLPEHQDFLERYCRAPDAQRQPEVAQAQAAQA